jgi:hypothetical protein
MKESQQIARSMTRQANEFAHKLQIGRRDRFIAAALTGLCANDNPVVVPVGSTYAQEVATTAIRIADALLEMDVVKTA